MKKVVLVLLLACLSVQAQHRVESKYDRFTDKTTVRLRFLRVFQASMRTVLLDATYQYKGQGERIEPPAVIWLDFYSTGDDRFDRDTKLYVIVDGERVQFDAENRIAVFTITFDRFQQMVNSKKIEMRIGDVELNLTDEIMKTLRDFIPKPAPKINRP